jgi:polyisoprenoid-binding protein YceI
MSTTEPTPSLETGTWTLDPSDSAVEFVTRSFWGALAVKGHFTEYEGRLDFSATPAIQLVISAASLDTGNAKRDEHLRSDDFFGAATNPEVRFESSDVHGHDDHLHVTGTLTAAGKSVTVEPNAHISAVDGGFEIDAVARVNHRELGMSAGAGGMIKATSWLTVRGKLIAAA